MKGMGGRWAALGAVLVAVVLVPGSSASSAVLALSYPSTGACAKSATGLNACIASATDGSTITIKPGTYFESGTVVAHSVTVTGSCGLPTSTVIDQGVAGDGFDVQASNVTIKCLTVRHGGTSHDGIVNTGAYNNLHVTQVDAFEEEYGIYQGTSGTTGLSVTSSKLMGSVSDGLYSAAVTGATVTGDTIENASGRCVELISLKKGTVSNNTLGVCGAQGVYIGAGANNTVSTNKISTIDQGCISVDSEATSITTNVIDGCNGPAIFVDGNDPTITSNQITGQVAGDTIQVDCGDNAVITGNTATGGNNAQYFITVCQQNSSAETITNNTESQGLVLFGVYCSPCDGATVTGNKILGGGQESGIHVDGHDPVVNGNTVAGGWNSVGIHVDCTAVCHGSQVEKNVESGSNGDYGYELFNNGCSGATPCMTISGNTSTGNKEDGYLIATSNALISGNQATGNGYSSTGCNAGASGFDIESDFNTVTGNTSTGNACDGFYVHGNSNELDGNTATGNFALGFQVEQTANTLDKDISTGNDGDGFNNDGTSTEFTNDKASGNRQDCTNDTTGGETATIAINTGNTCGDATNFAVTSTLTGW